MEGRVSVNGEVAEVGARVDVAVDVLEVDGALVPVRPGLAYYLLNKPAGVVTTAKDTHGRPTVIDLVPAEPRVFPVGLGIDPRADLGHVAVHTDPARPDQLLARTTARPRPGRGTPSRHRGWGG